jgi:hypothetical protein
LAAQTEGDIWVTGYRPFIPGDPDFGIAFWNFKSANPIIEYDLDLLVYLKETNASISSNTGEVLLITNGMEVQTRTGERIIDTIAFLDGGENWSSYFEDEYISAPFGFPKIQTAIILPVPDHPDEYSVIYYHGLTHPVILFFGVVAVLEARVRRMTDGSWEVLYKDKVIMENFDFLSQGTWHACRHANGRDWWMLIHDFEGSNYYRLLLDPTGLHFDGSQALEPQITNVNANSWFSPDGTKYAQYACRTLEENVLYIHDFDRCTGLLSNGLEISVTGDAMVYQGIAFSPNSRFLFAGVNAWELYQYDLWAPDIESSRMLVDTNDGYIEPNWFNTSFGPMMPGPDGRIYMFPISGTSRAVHVIDRPDERGKATKLLQHHIMLQTSNGKSVQNFANFRLGPLDGSSCDTLGLDNHPVSWWRHEVEDADPLEIRFTDLSYFRPEVWEWDFGDGDMSNEQNPIHTYPSPGLYYACLTVSNEYSADSSCHWIEIESVSTKDAGRDEVYIVHPNPFTDYIEITPPERYRTLRITIVDVNGRIVAAPELPCPCRLRLGSIPAGVYFYRLEEEGRRVGSGKLVKM